MTVAIHTSPNTDMPQHTFVIIGSGFAGLCMAIKLKEAGETNFVILEKDPEFGGTWRVNTYPGAACDVPSHLYSFSFAQNAEWTRKFPTQSEILAHMERVVADYGLAPYIRLNTAFNSADYDEAGGFWRVHTSNGEMTTRCLVSATGGLGRPSIPALKGLETFQGKSFHTSRWDHDFDLAGKRVAVIGSGASAVQIIPEIAPKVAQLDFYQRTPPWVIPRPDRAITAVERWLLRHVKPLQGLYRAQTYVRFEFRLLAFAKFPRLMNVMKKIALKHIERQMPHDPALRRKVTPDYTMGCKRILMINDYYPALTRSNVDIVTDGISEVRPNAIVTKEGQERPVDAIIFATGFQTDHLLGPIELRGRNGKSLQEADRGGLEAYKGVTIEGFPNFFVIGGPNTALAHNSIIYMIESSVNYVMRAVSLMNQQKLRSIEVRAEKQRQFNDKIQQDLKGTVWELGCKSWYRNPSGKNNLLWPGFTFSYRAQTRRFDQTNYHIERLAQ